MTIVDVGRHGVSQVAEFAWNAMGRERQLVRIMATRDVAAQATGILIDRYNLTADAAFSLLERLATASNGSVQDVARQFVSRETGALQHPHPGTGTRATGGPATEARRRVIREATRC
jgi:hypothetical protein